MVRRKEAISVLKEILDNCVRLDGHGVEVIKPNNPMSGYQIIIKGILDQENNNIHLILKKHQLISQTGNIWKTKRSLNKTEPDTFIIYRICLFDKILRMLS
jgi:hypothetical protein